MHANEDEIAGQQTHSGLDDLNQECEMLDVPGIGIVRIESLNLRSEQDFSTECCGIHGHRSIHGRTELHRKAGRAAVSGTTCFGTIEIATDTRY